MIGYNQEGIFYRVIKQLIAFKLKCYDAIKFKCLNTYFPKCLQVMFNIIYTSDLI